jgi:hypothetical protein
MSRYSYSDAIGRLPGVRRLAAALASIEHQQEQSGGKPAALQGDVHLIRF